MCFWWIVWLKDYYLHTGDISLIRALYHNVRANLRYFSRMENMHSLIDCKNENNPALLSRTVYVDDSTNKYPYHYSAAEYEPIFPAELFGYNITY